MQAWRAAHRSWGTHRPRRPPISITSFHLARPRDWRTRGPRARRADECVSTSVPPTPIAQVAAAEKASGKSETITIKAEKGRLSDEEIDRMVQEAEEFSDADKKVKDLVLASG